MNTVPTPSCAAGKMAVPRPPFGSADTDMTPSATDRVLHWPDGVGTATTTTSCTCCGRTLQAGELLVRLSGGAAHPACARVAKADPADRVQDQVPVNTSASDAAPSTPEPAAGDGCPRCYPNHLVWENEPPPQPGSCRFDVRFPGWQLQVAAASLKDAAWEAEEAVREHAPSETVEIRCSAPASCGHPDVWVQIYTVM